MLIILNTVIDKKVHGELGLVVFILKVWLQKILPGAKLRNLKGRLLAVVTSRSRR